MAGSCTTTRTIINDIPLRNNLRGSSTAATMYRNCVAWAEDDNGVVQSYAIHIPRISPTKGMLVEEARKNELIWTNVLDQVAWSHQGIGNGTDPTITADQAIAPDGTMTADKIDFGPCGTGDSNSILFRSTAPAGLFVESVYLRTVTGTGSVWLGHSPDGVAAWQSVECACDTTWRRFTLPVSSVSGSRYFILGQDGRDAAQPATFPAVSVYAWNAQSEVGSFTTSPITASAAQVTRAADIATCSTTGWPTKEGSITFDFTPGWSSGGALASTYYILDSRTTERGILFYIGNTATGDIRLRTGNTDGYTDTSAGAMTWTAGTTYRIEARWGKGNTFLWRTVAGVRTLLVSNVTGAARMPDGYTAAATLVQANTGTLQSNGSISNLRVGRN